jgi:purine-binding chemotaxis protein CheW
MDRQLVVFELSNEQFGVIISAVESIIKIQPITRVPHTPVYIEGVTNLRGKVVPVVDLRKRFGMEAALKSEDKRDPRRIVIISLDGAEIGVVVDSVSEVLTINDSWVEPPPSMALTVESAFITGIIKLENRLIMLLDLAKVFAIQERIEI